MAEASAPSGFPIDVYQLEVLVHEYDALNPKERIDFLKQLRNTGELPFEVASIAVRDSVAMVRAWAAAHLYLDYREYLGRRTAGPFYRFPERNLFEVVEADPDPFVRARLHENSNFYRPLLDEPSQEESVYFAKASPLERLAIVRRTDIDRDLIKDIFDPDKKELGIEQEERKAFALAFLSNRSDREKIRDLSRGFGEAESRAGQPLNFADTAGGGLEDLWRLALKWPEGSGVQALVFKYVNCSDEIIEDIFSKCRRAEWRYAILSNEYHFDDDHSEDCAILKLAIIDEDAAVRQLAYERLKLHSKNRELRDAAQRALRAADEPAIRGLLRNRFMPAKWEKEIAKRFPAIYLQEQARLTVFSWEKVRYPELPGGKPIAWTQDQKMNYLGQLTSESAFASLRMRETLLLAGFGGLMLSLVAHLVSQSFPLSFFLLTSSVLTGAVAVLVVDARKFHVPPWLTLTEWAEQWAPWGGSWRRVQEAGEASERKEDFFQKFWYYGGDRTAAEHAAYDLCREATTEAERNILRDYVNALAGLGRGHEEIEKALSPRLHAKVAGRDEKGPEAPT